MKMAQNMLKTKTYMTGGINIHKPSMLVYQGFDS